MENKKKDSVAVLVAHPDDETLWAGGTLLTHREWQPFIGALCRGGDLDRAPKFFRVLAKLGAEGAMADLDDGPGQTALDDKQVQATLISLLPTTEFDLIFTHAPGGEYTSHRRHTEVSRAVLQMWAKGRLASPQLWLFAYEDGGGSYLPRAAPEADLLINLADETWTRKKALLTSVYGFDEQSWEVLTTPRQEAFWCLKSREDAFTYLKNVGR